MKITELNDEADFQQDPLYNSALKILGYWKVMIPESRKNVQRFYVYVWILKRIYEHSIFFSFLEIQKFFANFHEVLGKKEYFHRFIYIEKRNIFEKNSPLSKNTNFSQKKSCFVLSKNEKNVNDHLFFLF